MSGVTANPQYGYLTLNGVRLGIGSVFTQQDVIDGDVHYVHTATGATQNQPDSFGVRANDGATPVAASAAATIALTIAPVNQAPTVSGLGVVLEGQPGNAVDGTGAPLSQVGNFIVADGGGDDASSALTVRITGLPTDGTLYFTGTALVNGTSVNYTVPHAITAAELATGSGFVIAYEARAGLTYGNNGTRDNTGAGTLSLRRRLQGHRVGRRRRHRLYPARRSKPTSRSRCALSTTIRRTPGRWPPKRR